MKYSIQDIAHQIKEARESKGLSQRALSIKVGIPQSHLSKIEQGKVDLQLSSLIEIARVLDLELVLIHRKQLSILRAFEEPISDIPAAYQLNEEENDD